MVSASDGDLLTLANEDLSKVIIKMPASRVGDKEKVQDKLVAFRLAR